MSGSKIPLIVVVDRMDHAITTMSPLVVSVLGVTSVYYVAFSYGLGVIALLYGRNGASQVVSNVSTNPLLVVAGVPLIPVGLVALEAADLEGRALNVWRANVSPLLPRLPLVGRPIEWLWPTPTRKPLASSQDGLGGAIDVMARSISSGLLLPFIAYFVGGYCFKSVSSNATRVFMGGVLFYVLKALLKMYLRQQQYRRQGSRRVLDYAHEP